MTRYRRFGLAALTVAVALAAGLALPAARGTDAAQYTAQVGNGSGGIAVIDMENVG